MFRWIGFACNVSQTLANSHFPVRLLASHPSAETISGSIRTMNNPKRLAKLPKGHFQAITLTDSALKRAKELLSQQPDAIGLRIGVRTRGCNGLSYTLSFCSERQKGDEVVVQDGVSVFIDRKAQLTLLGSEMHFRETPISAEFVFNNPNVKGICGCGESFSV